ncbi:serine/threonine-protein kinase [Chondromyces crocatus]|uniref:Protein kinase domain-containing protein n=1 Tax=Chondromyces crocatus TaxID=52 RepID=A0A0K1EBX1_CHOCO|nr:serine/threonine-protein kinase [Chondromyces crocatus]AKT38354.1 uncharacterized protein CMC5_025000 [Chondromyces crocatus]
MQDHGPLLAGNANESDLRHAESLLGRVLSNRYRIDALLAMGGLGAVYVGEHVHMHKRVALKVLHASSEQDPEMVRRFEREAIAGAHVQHPNVATATDFGELPGGSYFLVLEYIQGTSLSEIIRRGPLPVPRALHIARQIAAGLEAVHTMGIVHRDVKPLNVMVAEGQGDLVKLIDFGFARVPVDRLASADGVRVLDLPKRLTRAGRVFGTLSYLAPEAAEGMDAIEAPADLYALGLMFYEMVAGKPPFEAENAIELFEQQRFAPPPMIAERSPGVSVPMPVELLILRLLAKDPKKRPQDASAVIEAIDEAAAGLGLDLMGGTRSSRLPGRGGSLIPPPGGGTLGGQLASIPPVATGASMPPPGMPGMSTPPPAVSAGRVWAEQGALAARAARAAREAKYAGGLRGAGAGRQDGKWTWVGAFAVGAMLSLGTVFGVARLGAVEAASAASMATALPLGSLPEIAVEAETAPEAEPEVVATAVVEREALLASVTVVDPAVGAETLLALLEREPGALRERPIAVAAREVAAAIGRVDGELTDRVFDALARRAGSEGLDVLYEVMASRGTTPPARRAAALLRDPEITLRSTPTMQVALDLRLARCRDKLGLLERAVEEGDRRALVALEANVKFCFQKHPLVASATQRLRDRLNGK